MATDGDTLITELSTRLRDPNNERHARTLVRDVLTQCQRLVNLHTADVITERSFTPTTGQTLYANTAIITPSDVAKILSIRDGSRDLHEIQFRELATSDIRWLRRQAFRHELFARIGGSLFALYPAVESPVALTVVYVTVPAAVVDGATAIDISDENEPLLLDLAEATLHMRMRTWSALPDLLERIKKLAPGLPTKDIEFEEEGRT